MAGRRGQATIEWAALTLLVAVVLAGAALATGAVDAGWLPAKIRCAVTGGCQDGDPELVAAYGSDTAALVRGHAPGIVYERGTLTLPVDFRQCRRHHCSDGPDRAGEEVHRSARGDHQATAFTHVTEGRDGATYVQYWLYYPDSTLDGRLRVGSRAVRDAAPAVPLALVPLSPIGAALATPIGDLVRREIPEQGLGHHPDDWESYQVRIWPDGRVEARASAHYGYAGHRTWPNPNEAPDDMRDTLRRLRRVRGQAEQDPAAWIPVTGYTRVSRGSHAGHLVDGFGDERRTEVDGLRLVPIERLSAAERATDFGEITPPWEKAVYDDPMRNDT